MKKNFLIAISLFITSCSQTNKIHNLNKNTFYKINTGITNIYLLKGLKGNILIDTSIDGKENFIEKELEKYDVLPKNLSLIILTHAHGDHAGNAKYFQEKYNIPIMVGEGDEILTRQGKNNDLVVTGFLGAIVKPFVDYKYRAFEPDILLKDDFSLINYGIDGYVTRIGGHTKGSLAVISGKNAFVGDLIRGGIIFNKKPALHFFHDNLKQSHNSLKDIINTGCDNIYPAHWGDLKSKDILESKILEN